MAQGATDSMLSMALVVGAAPITGFSGGGAIRFADTVDDFIMRIGVGGLGSFTRVVDDSGVLSIDLDPNSDGNDLLDIALRFSKVRPNGNLVAVSWTDLTGRFGITTAGAVVMKAPDTTHGDGSGVNTWGLMSVRWNRVTGGRDATSVVDIADMDIAAQPSIDAAS